MLRLLSESSAVILVCIGVTFALLLGTVFHRTTNAALPYLDSLTTSTSLVLSVMGYRQWRASLSGRGLARARAA